MNQHLVILAGGISSRMKKSDAAQHNLDSVLQADATLKSKTMIGVGSNHRPFLDYLLVNAQKAGFNDVVIVVGEKDESIRQYYGMHDQNSQFKGISISFAVQKIAPERHRPAGTADALLAGLRTRTDWSGSSFVVCNSDNLYSVKAFETLATSHHKNAMLDYDRDGLQFPQERIRGFAITEKNSAGYLVGIHEKPCDEVIRACSREDGSVGVSMNAFLLNYDMILPCLEKVPFDPVRNEKELPAAVVMMIQEHPDSVFAYPFCEYVPDLTSKQDILTVKRFLEKNFSADLFA